MMAGAAATLPITGHCYCGAIAIEATRAPEFVAYCHCDDCRRVTGGPVAAFAGFGTDSVRFSPDEGSVASFNPGVSRSFCSACGSPLASRFDYLPDQVYVPVGVLDQAGELAPQMHSYESQRLPWLHIGDEAIRFDGSSRTHLTAAEGKKERWT